MADPLTELGKLDQVIALAMLQNRRVPWVAAQAMAETLAAILQEQPNAADYSAAALLLEYRRRIVAGRGGNG